MKRFQLLVLISMITAGAIWWSLYRSRHTSSAAISELLPKTTLALAHMPDFNRARTEFRQTDLYQLWTEPALQDFLQEPRTKIHAADSLGSILQDCEALQLKDAFAALLTIEVDRWKMIGGFRFKGDPEKAEKLVATWKGKILGHGLDSKPETVDYEGHQIQVETKGSVRIAEVRDGQWFFIANDLEELKTLIDRVDGRVKNIDKALTADDAFAAASKRMPSSYIGLGFARIDQLVEKLMHSTNGTSDVPTDQLAAIRQIRSVCGATSFDGTKIRDTVFVGMPKLLDAGSLSRASLPIATKDAFLYAAGFLNLTKPLPLPGSQGALGWMGGLQKISHALASNGVTLDLWNSAFGPELSWIGEWPTNARWPSLFATLPVKDSAKAGGILGIITTTDQESFRWTQQEKEGVRYFSTRTGGRLFSFSPTIGLSERMLVAGPDAGSVETVMKRSANGTSELATSKIFLRAERTVPTAKQAFSYIDPALIYTRIDAILRPILLWSAAFVPGIADTVDLNKLPAPEVIARHLSPIVMSQSYDGDGYIAESVGPITLCQAIVGAGGLGGAAAVIYQYQTQKLTHNRKSEPTDGTTAAEY